MLLSAVNGRVWCVRASLQTDYNSRWPPDLPYNCGKPFMPEDMDCMLSVKHPNCWLYSLCNAPLWFSSWIHDCTTYTCCRFLHTATTLHAVQHVVPLAGWLAGYVGMWVVWWVPWILKRCLDPIGPDITLDMQFLEWLIREVASFDNLILISVYRNIRSISINACAADS